MGGSAELGNPPDSLPASDRRQRGQVAVFTGQGQEIRRVDRRRDHSHERLAGLELRRLELHGVNHVLRRRAASLVLGSEHQGSEEGTGYPAGTSSRATTAWPRDVMLNRSSFTGW